MVVAVVEVEEDVMVVVEVRVVVEVVVGGSMCNLSHCRYQRMSPPSSLPSSASPSVASFP